MKSEEATRGFVRNCVDTALLPLVIKYGSVRMIPSDEIVEVVRLTSVVAIIMCIFEETTNKS